LGKKTFCLIVFILVLLNNAYAIPFRVTVTNVSKGEKLPNYPVIIKIVNPKTDGTFDTVKSLSFETDSTGFFEGTVDESTGKAIVGELNYRGITYSSPLIRIEKGEKKYSLDLSVFEITDSMENVAISQRMIMASPLDDKTIQVFEKLIVENQGNFSYVGRFNDELDTHQVLYVPVPQWYRLTQVQGIDARKILTYNRGIITQEGIIPGQREIFLGYTVQSDTGFFDLTLFSAKDSPQIKDFSFLFQKSGDWSIKIPRFTSAGDSEFFGKVYNTWKGKAGSKVPIKVYGPAYKGLFGMWTVALVLASVVGITGLYSGKNVIRIWHLRKENKRLEMILSRLKDEADQRDLKGYYLPFKQTLEKRLNEIKQRLSG
jgi:hypothetical protein